VARVLANFGFEDLRLVRPAVAVSDPRAVAAATHGADVLAGARVYPDLATAIADLHAVVGTTAVPRDLRTPVEDPRAGTAALGWLAPEARVGFVFGGERAGMTSAELARCHVVWSIPTAAPARALNLVQAVTIMAWEWRRGPAPRAAAGRPTPAPLDAQERFFAALELRIEACGLWQEPGLRARTLRNLRGTLLRAGFTPEELQTLRGLVEARERR
jgi:tRNA/rRNA methyltransferase